MKKEKEIKKITKKLAQISAGKFAVSADSMEKLMKRLEELKSV